jgi:hypothetical protein
MEWLGGACRSDRTSVDMVSMGHLEVSDEGASSAARDPAESAD